MVCFRYAGRLFGCVLLTFIVVCSVFPSSMILCANENGDSEVEELVGVIMDRSKEFKVRNDDITKLTEQAENGDVQAMALLGSIYLVGNEVERDIDKALKLLELSAEGGDIDAQGVLGKLYLECPDELNIPVNNEKGIKWSKLAAEQGDVDSQLRLGAMYLMGGEYEQDFEQALKWNTMAAEQGDYQSMALLGYMYYNGEGIEVDYKKAFELLSVSAEHDQALAQAILGGMYLAGEYVEQDPKKCFELYKKATENGGSLSTYLVLGQLYENGIGVEQNYNEAKKCYEIATLGGVEGAKEVLEQLKETMKE